MPEKMVITTMVDIGITTPTTTTTTRAPYPQVNIRKFSPGNRPSSTKRPKNASKPKYQSSRIISTQSSVDVNEPQGDQPQQKLDVSSNLPSDYKLRGSDDKSSRLLEEILSRAKTPKEEEKTESTKIDISKFLPPGYKPPKDEEDATEGNVFKNTKADDISKFLPPGYTTPKTEEKSTESSNTKVDDISKFLPPGYKLPKKRG
ncbi:hypothetical protein NQ314_004005 [Rhamnusium bicolor]|uniref:Uncharacterized protein n=1 Tax=Rhamnusium bicolor TaxID=1586634 RepID=A0AAV8ZKW6_9CUCU|nr:hypothetical protein NQ314_004005 [Rhamnusium bicolor]